MRVKWIVLLLLITAISIPLLGKTIHTEEKLADVLQVVPEDVSEIVLIIPSQPDKQKRTTDKEKIAELLRYLDRVEYKRLRGDVSSYMPMKAGILFLYGGEKEDFIVSYGKEAMVSKKVYRLKNGTIDNAFLERFYHSLEEKGK